MLDKTGKKCEFNVTIPKILKQNTISINNNKHLKEYLQQMEADIRFRKEEKTREEFLQNNLFLILEKIENV